MLEVGESLPFSDGSCEKEGEKLEGKKDKSKILLFTC
jgi:hypothetical protein